MKADQQSPAASHRRCAEVSGGAEQVMQQRRFVWRGILQIKLHDLFAPCRDDTVHAAHQRQGLVPAATVLGRVGLRGDFDLVLRKKLLRTRAGFSA
jgi:hypothetical protein